MGFKINENSKILILGSFSSVKSREKDFFYGYLRNCFWRVLDSIFATDLPVTIEEKKNFLYNNRVTVWDVIGSCDITGSSDSIKIYPQIKREAICLPSISPANAAWSLERLIEEWGKLYEEYEGTR